MLRVSKLSDYATVLLGLLADVPERVRSATELAEVAHLELPTASKVLKLLAAANLVESFRGVSGGYRLARPAQAISVAEIVEAIDGPIGMTECSLHEGLCNHEVHCGVRAPWQRISRVIVGALREVSLAQMIGIDPAPPPQPQGSRIAAQLQS